MVGLERRKRRMEKRMDRAMARQRTVQLLTAMAETRLALRTWLL